MCNDALIRRIAGLFVLASVMLGYWVHPAFFAFTAFVGFNLFQSSLTGLLPAGADPGQDWPLRVCAETGLTSTCGGGGASSCD